MGSVALLRMGSRLAVVWRGDFELVGLLLLLMLNVGAVLFAWRRGYSVGRILVHLLGVVVGSALGGALPACVLVGQAIAGAVTGFGRMNWSGEWLVLFVLGSAAGALAGLWAVDRMASRPRSPAAAWVAAFAGFMTGVAFSFLASLLVPEEDGSAWAGYALWILTPLAIAAATVAGYSLQTLGPATGVLTARPRSTAVLEGAAVSRSDGAWWRKITMLIPFVPPASLCD